MASQTRASALLQFAQEASQSSQPALRRPRPVAARRHASLRTRSVVVNAFGRGQSGKFRYDSDLGLGDSGDAVKSLQSTLSILPTTGVRLGAAKASHHTRSAASRIESAIAS